MTHHTIDHTQDTAHRRREGHTMQATPWTHTHDGQNRAGRRRTRTPRVDPKRTAQARAATLERRDARRAKYGDGVRAMAQRADAVAHIVAA